jgi:hypothetical protein
MAPPTVKSEQQPRYADTKTLTRFAGSRNCADYSTPQHRGQSVVVTAQKLRTRSFG